ncbi:MAG: sodium/proline symporter [Deltaproteobacteria bacterium]|nr:sodium/proline symporter [Deltaproteobacteria bacterium]
MDTPYLGLIAYLVLIAIVGAWTWRMNLTKEDFILGGRKLGAFVIAFSERTAAESSWLVLGLSGALFAVGMLELWTVVGCVSGIILYWYVIARRLRVVSEEFGAITLPEYFFQFSGEQGQLVRFVSMVIIIFFFSLYVSAQFIGAGKVLDVTFGIPVHWGMPLAAVVVVLYTMMGGFAAVCYTDVVQGFIMVFTLVVMPLVGLWYLHSNGMELGPALAAAGDAASVWGGKTGWAAAAAAIGGLSWGLGYMGQPHLVTKFMAVNRADAIRASRRVAIVWTLLAYSGAALIGIVGMALVHYGVVPTAGLTGQGGDPERILPVLANQLFPAWMAGILISGAVAAMMSTADSQILIATSTLVEDVYSKALGRTLTQRGMVRLSRAITVLVGVAAFILAWVSKDLIYGIVSMAWTGLGSSFGPALLLSLHWRRMNGRGVVAGMLVGAGTTVLWNCVPALDVLISARFAAFALALAACVVAALTAPPGRTAVRREPGLPPGGEMAGERE